MSLLAKGGTAVALSCLLCTGTQAVTLGCPGWGGEREGGNVPGAAGRQIERDNLGDSVDKTNMQ